MNKTERHQIYKEALEFYKTGDGDVLCFCISRCAREYLNRHIFIVELRELFPEFASFMPKVLINDNNWKGLWWMFKDRKSRIDCLEKCIEMTK